MARGGRRQLHCRVRLGRLLSLSPQCDDPQKARSFEGLQDRFAPATTSSRRPPPSLLSLVAIRHTYFFPACNCPPQRIARWWPRSDSPFRRLWQASWLHFLRPVMFRSATSGFLEITVARPCSTKLHRTCLGGMSWWHVCAWCAPRRAKHAVGKSYGT